MTDIKTNIKPCLVQTAQGFTVSYDQKFLYSKYNPSKAILQIIENLELLPQTIVLCVSPVLPYGLNELAKKLPEDCLILCCEFDNELADFSRSQVKDFSFLTKEELLNLGPLLTKRNVVLKCGLELPPPGTFRRIIRIDFSAAAQFNSELYDKVIASATNALMTFWANRVTLVKFGRKYCTNFFKNLALLDKTTPIQNYFGAIEKPIFVFGAGESAQDGIECLKQKNRNDFFILCADTALQPLAAQDITPDGVFIEEAQNVILKCFIGTQNEDIHIFAGLSSVHSITGIFAPEKISFFTTEFVQAAFLERFEKQGLLPPKNEPFGSVGITAYYYAHIFKKDESVPIYTYGLDFAYSAGRTHTKGAMADNTRFQTSNRIKPDTNFAAAFKEPAFKKNEKMYTTPIMARYKQIFDDLSSSGLTRGSIIKRDCRVKPDNDITEKLSNEVSALQELKSLLSGEKQLPSEQLEKEITHLITEREYLYLHFPDGHKFVYTQSFLNRVRVEIDYYLKILKR